MWLFGYNSKMNFSLNINPADQWANCLQTALSLAQTICDNGHTVTTVLFYGQAIKVLQNQQTLLRWQQWQRQSNAQLLLCSTLVEANDLMDLANQTEGFTVTSLGSWVKAMEHADKTVELC